MSLMIVSVIIDSCDNDLSYDNGNSNNFNMENGGDTHDHHNNNGSDNGKGT